MATAPFASRMDRLNRAVFACLSDAVATINGVDVSVLSSNGFSLGAVGPFGMAGTQPDITLQTTDVPTNPVGATVVMGAVTYLVAAHEPDGLGVSRLLLESAT